VRFSLRESQALRSTSYTCRARNPSSRFSSRARRAGTCGAKRAAQYFFVDYTFLERPNFEGAKYVYTPPPRAKENQDVLWTPSVPTHCRRSRPTLRFLWDGQKTMGRDDFSKIRTADQGWRIVCR